MTMVMALPAKGRADSPAPHFRVTTTILGKTHHGNLPRSIVTSPDCEHLAYLVKDGQLWQVVIDGKPQPDREWVLPGSLVFSPDSNHFAYCVQTGSHMNEFIDGQSGDDYYEILDEGRVVFSPDGKHSAFVATDGKTRFVVKDGRKDSLTFDAVQYLTFSADSQHFYYCARGNGKNVVVADGLEGKPYDTLGMLPVFSSDGRIGYSAKMGDEYVVVIGSQEDRSHPNGANDLAFSPDGKHTAFAARSAGNKECVVVDGKEAKDFDAIARGTIVWSPDSKHLAYIGRSGSQYQVVLDGTIGKRYDFGLYQPAFSPDSSRIGCVMGRGHEQFVVINGQEEQAYDEVSPLFFSPDSMHITYIAYVRPMFHAVVDGTLGPAHARVAIPSFSPSGNKVAYASIDSTTMTVIFDSYPITETFDGFLAAGKTVFDSPTTLHCLAMKDDEFLLVNVQVLP